MSAELIDLPAADENRRRIEARLRAVLDAPGDGICGFAIVVWCRDGSSTADMGANSESGPVIPDILIPDFVRNRLLGMKIEQWAIDTITGPPKPAGA